jgi:hypothetical protein
MNIQNKYNYSCILVETQNSIYYIKHDQGEMFNDVMTLGDSLTYLADESPFMHLDCGEIHMHDASCFKVTCTYTYAYTEDT